ncbi:T9SS type B sorting domain-containing protein [Flavobacteriaceae bacterium]|nr:T9SS type B sorting domain-containing protein [Flavobacteriaceae bacterium]
MKNNIYISLIGFFFILGITKSHSQLNAITIGDADSLGGNCYRITEDVLWQAGGVWYDNPIDFADDFTIYYKNNFGTKDTDGADGMALVFKMTSSAVIGASGAGIGYEGIANSLVVEFDTYQNTGVYNDPWHDHIAILENGIAHHSSGSNLAGPVQPTSTLTDMEDGVDHNVKIVWTAATQTFEVFFDCELRLTLIQDIKNTIFGGDSSVFFGFVGSTGGLSNLHQVCFNRISFIDNLVLQDQTICEGESVQVDAEIPSGDTYTWSPSTGVSDINIANPILSPSTTTTYTVTIEDECGDTTTENVEIIVTPKDPTVFNPISPICIGDPNPLPTSDTNGVTGTWSPAFDPNTTTTYTFTPDAGQCANSSDLEIIVLPETTPDFTQITDVCIGTSLTIPTTSNNGITGTWSPAFDPNTTTTYTFTPDAGQCADNVDMTIGITPLTIPTFTAIDPICIGDTIGPLPTTSNNGIAGTWSPLTIDNTTTTEYTFTPNGSGCFDETTLEIVVLQQVTPTFQIDDICIGETIPSLPNFSQEGISGTWSPAINNLATTTYTFTPDPGQCANSTTETIQVNLISTLAIITENTSAPFESNQIVEVTVTGGSGNYEYQLDGGNWQTSSIFQNVVGCQDHIVKVRDAEGCSNEPESAVTILSYPKFFTPNGDGFNDFWNIKCLRNSTGLVSIFDRFGKLLKQFKTTGSGWNGTYNNNLMPTSDYWFLVTYYDENGIEKEFRSHFTLRR